MNIKLTLILAAIRAAGKIAKSIGPRSPGGKRITPGERDEILATLLDEASDALDAVTDR